MRYLDNIQTISGNAGGALHSQPNREVQSLADYQQTASVQSRMVCRAESPMKATAWRNDDSSVLPCIRLSSYSSVWQFPQYRGLRLHPAVDSSRPEQKRFSPDSFLPMFPSAVRSHRATDKKKSSGTVGNLTGWCRGFNAAMQINAMLLISFMLSS